MIEITVEELDIIVQASVEQALTEFKKIVPQLKKTMKQVEDNLNNVDAKGMVVKVQEAVQQVKNKVNEVKNTGVDKQLQSQFNKAGASVEKYQGQLEETKQKLREVYAQMDRIQTNTWKQYTPDGVELGNKAIEPAVNNDLAGNKQYQSLSKQASKLEEQIVSLNSKLNTTKQEYGQIAGQIQQVSGKQSIWSKSINKIKNILSTVKKNISNAGNAFGNMTNLSQKVRDECSRILSITGKISGRVKQIGTGFKQGLGHVLRYAGALFSLQTAYSVLSSAAQSWLSSQNAGAQQLSANIEYMKYALGSALASVIQFVTNLVYQLLKAIQSVVYALTGINIFANASAKSYSNMANSAKKASKASKEQAKSLTGVHDEINNVPSPNNSGNGDGSGSGSIAPSFDLSQVNNMPSSIIEAIKNGNWYEIGSIIGEKLNEAMNSIPWEKIQEGAKQIGTGIASLLNGFIATTNWSQVGNTFAQGLNTVIYLGYSFVTTFNWAQFGQAIGNAINGFFNNIDWNKLSSTFSNGLNGIFTYINNYFITVDWSGIASNLVNGLNNAISNIDWNLIGTTVANGISSIIDFLYTTVTNFDWLGLGMSLADSINSAFTGIDWSKVGQTLSNAITGLLWSVISFLGEIDWYQLGKSIGDFIANIDWISVLDQVGLVICEAIGALFMALVGFVESILTNLGQWLYDNIVEPCTEIFSELWSKIQEIFSNIGQWFKDKFQQAYDGIVSVFKGIGQWFIDRWNDICNVFSNIGNWFRSKFQDAYNSITSVFSRIGSFFSGIWNNIKNTFSNLGTNIGNAISNAVKSGINGVISLIEGAINKAIGLINGAISLINLIPGVNIGKLATLKLPRLAKGAVLKVPTVAEMAEYPGASTNPEIVTPQNIMEETFDRVMSRYQDSNNSQPIYLTVNVGNTKLGQILLNDLRTMKRRSGKDIEALVGG